MLVSSLLFGQSSWIQNAYHRLPDFRFLVDRGRFPFNKNRRFKFSEFTLVEWNASNRFPEFEVMCSAMQDMLGKTVVFEMVGFLKIFATLEQHGCETISCTILYRNDDVKLVAAIACFMRRELTRVNEYLEVTIPGNLLFVGGV